MPKINNSNDYIGLEITNNFGSKIKIIEYNGWDNVIVQFEDGYKKKIRYDYFKSKNIKSPYERRTYGLGYLGEGENKTKENGKHTYKYKTWDGILQRCYSKIKQELRPTYKDCTVCEEWHNFQNFGKWFDENFYQIENETMCLDKDILHKGNKIYSPETCIFVPNRINVLFTKSDKTRGKYPIGVQKHKNKFIARCSTYNNNNCNEKYLGSFYSAEEAFNSYKIFKEKYIKQVADEYKDKIPQKLYEAMYNYKVDITD